MLLLRYLVIGLVFWTGAMSAGASEHCAYELVSFQKDGTKAVRYGLLARQETENVEVPRFVVDVTNVVRNAPDFFSTELRAALAKVRCEYLAKPEDFAASLVELVPEEIAPAIPQSRNVVAMGLNHRAHAAEVGRDGADGFIFAKNVAFTGAYSAISRPAFALLDYEVEIGVVIRKEITPGTVITPENVREYIAGFVLANDVSNRTPILLDKGDGKFTAAKTYAGFLPVGPYYAPIENFTIASGAFLPKLAMKTSVVGAVGGAEVGRQDASSDEADFFVNLGAAIAKALETRDLVDIDADLKPQKLLARGKFEPGDLLLMGTVAGVALRLTESQGRNIVLKALNPNLFNPMPTIWPHYKEFFRDPTQPDGYNYGGGPFASLGPAWMRAKTHLVLHQYCSSRLYLQSGDLVKTSIAGLGTQRSLIVLDEGDPAVAAELRLRADDWAYLAFCSLYPPQ